MFKPIASLITATLLLAVVAETVEPEKKTETKLTVADQIKSAGEHFKKYQWTPALKELNEVVKRPDASPEEKARANLLLGDIYKRWKNTYPKAREAYGQALASNFTTPEERLKVRRTLIDMLLHERRYADAREAMKALLKDGGLADRDRIALSVSVAKTLVLDGKFQEARDELTRTLALSGLTDADKADVQLWKAISLYDEKNDEAAAKELRKVLTMPDANAFRWHLYKYNGTYVPSREAEIRLHLRDLIPEEKKTLNVLYIGSSHTARGVGVPRLVEQIAESDAKSEIALASARFIQSGTGIDTFWEDGDGPGTVRRLIESEPWDVVVFETFIRTKLFTKYAKLFADLAKSGNAKVVIYETPVPKNEPYPDSFRDFHKINVALSEDLNVALAPTVDAFVEYVGPTLDERKFNDLYNDVLHASPKGYYLVACCIYSAIIGRSPVGLAHPKGIPQDEAAKLQEAAWKSFMKRAEQQ